MTDPTSLPNIPQSSGAAEPPPEEPLRDRVVAALTALELSPEVDPDGDVAVTFQEQQIFVRSSDEGADILRVFGQWRLEDPVPTEPTARLEVCNEVNASFNLIKTAIARDTLLVTSEHLLPRGGDVAGLLAVTLPLLLQGVQLWHQRATGGSLEPPTEDEADATGGPDGGPDGREA